MSKFSRRLRKLESQVFDDSGLVPNSPEWYEYWLQKIRRCLTSQTPGSPDGPDVEVPNEPQSHFPPRPPQGDRRSLASLRERRGESKARGRHHRGHRRTS